MIVRMQFIGTVKDAKGKKKKMKDFIDIHCGTIAEARGMFKTWLLVAEGLKGDSGVFHPLKNYGTIELAGVEKL